MPCPNCGCQDCLLSNRRTLQQNCACHLYFTLLADALNNAGYDLQKTLRVDVPWTPETVKELLWKPVLHVYKQKTSTTQMTIQDVNNIYDIVNRAIGERTGVYVPFPSQDEKKQLQSQEIH